MHVVIWRHITRVEKEATLGVCIPLSRCHNHTKLKLDACYPAAGNPANKNPVIRAKFFHLFEPLLSSFKDTGHSNLCRWIMKAKAKPGALLHSTAQIEYTQGGKRVGGDSDRQNFWGLWTVIALAWACSRGCEFLVALAIRDPTANTIKS